MSRKHPTLGALEGAISQFFFFFFLLFLCEPPPHTHSSLTPTKGKQRPPPCACCYPSVALRKWNGRHIFDRFTVGPGRGPSRPAPPADCPANDVLWHAQKRQNKVALPAERMTETKIGAFSVRRMPVSFSVHFLRTPWQFESAGDSMPIGDSDERCLIVLTMNSIAIT